MKVRLAAAIIAALFSIAFLVGIAVANAASYPSLTQIDRDGDFDPCGNVVGSGAGCWRERVSGNTGTVNVAKSRVFEGATAGRFTWPSGNDERAELNWGSLTSPNPYVEYELLAWIPSSVDFANYLSQHKYQGAGSGCSNGGLKVTTSGIVLTTRAGCSSEAVEYSLGPMPRNRWVAIKIREKFSDTNGSVEGWVEANATTNSGYVKRLPLTTGIDTASDGSEGVKFRLGPYDGDQDGGTIWLDGHRMRFLSGPLATASGGWAKPIGFGPLTNGQAASMVKRSSWEPRPQNEENRNVPTTAQVESWRSGHWMPNSVYVNGRFRGTTDEVIQWAAYRWGFHPRVFRAVAVKESWWDMDLEGDAGDSFGLFQVRRPYHCSGECRIMRDFSAMNADYYGAILRYYFDGEATWLNDQERGEDYGPGDLWGSVGAWYAGRWRTPAAESYIGNTQDIFWERTWKEPGF